MMAVFFQPVWLLLLVPMAVAWWVWPLPSRWLRVLRAVLIVLIVFALAQFAIRLPDRSGTVIVVADRSESMPNKADASEKEIVDLLHKSMRAHDELAWCPSGVMRSWSNRRSMASLADSPGRSERGILI